MEDEGGVEVVLGCDFDLAVGEEVHFVAKDRGHCFAEFLGFAAEHLEREINQMLNGKERK